MKIDLNGAYRAYAKNSTTLPLPGDKAAGKDDRVSAGNIDRVSISSEAAQKSELDKLVHSAAAEADAAMSAEKLSQLRLAVQSGEYNVPTEKLADAVLDAYV